MASELQKRDAASGIVRNSSAASGLLLPPSRPGGYRLQFLVGLLVLSVVGGAAWWRSRAHGDRIEPNRTASSQSARQSLTASLLGHTDAEKTCRDWKVPADPYTDADPAAAQEAFEACTKAVARQSNDAGLFYQLGSAALESSHVEESFAAFTRAQQLGSCDALYFLGRFSWGDHDLRTTEDYYRRGAACGDERAAHELFRDDVFGTSAYPESAKALYDSDVPQLNRVRFLSASYVAGFYEALSDQFLGKDMDPCWAATYYKGGDVLFGIQAAEQGDSSNILESLAYEKSLPLLFHVIFPAQGSKSLEQIRETERKAGQADLIRMTHQYHCGALLPYKMAQGVQRFATTPKSLLATVREAAPNVHSIQDMQSLIRQTQHVSVPAEASPQTAQAGGGASQ